MKDFINIFITVILVLLFVTIAFMLNYKIGEASGILYFPLIIMMFIWGKKLYDDY